MLCISCNSGLWRIVVSQQEVEAETFDDLKGLSQRSPWLALSVNGIAILGLGIFPAPLFMICQEALGSLLR